jgi:predicted PurR-regulated permease PerM
MPDQPDTGPAAERPAVSADDQRFVARVVEATIRVGLLALLVAWCFQIVHPFVVPAVWGIIIAVAAYPGYARLQSALGGRRVLAATVFTLIALVVLIVPTVLLSGTLVEGARTLATGVQEGTLRIPPPPEGVGAWPFIGEWVERFWRQASVNLGAALEMVGPQLKTVGAWLLSGAAGLGVGILQFVLALVIAGVILANAEPAQRAAYVLAKRLAGERGADFARLAEATVRSVTRGILGVALIQSLLAGLGFLAVGVPAAGLWALIALLLSVVQIGVFPVVIPVLIYVFFTADTATFVVFLIWSVFVGSIDNVLKPILLGRGVAVPMAVIFVGAIGGFLSSGIIGLFVGSVVLVLSYKLFLAWIYEVTPVPVNPAGTPPPST